MRQIADGLPFLVFGCRGTGERTWSSPQWRAYTGLSDAGSRALGWLDAIHPDDRPVTMQAWEMASYAGNCVAEHRIRRAHDGRFFWHQTRAVRLSGEASEWVGGSADIDEMHLMHERVARAESDLRVLVEGAPQLLWRSCEMGNWTWASPQWLDFTGQDQEQTHGRGWLNAVHPDDHDQTLVAWGEARAHGLLDVEFRVRRASDGAYLWHRTRSTPVRDQDGRIVEWLGSTTDVQDLKESQQRQQVLLAELQYHMRDLEEQIRERKRIETRLIYSAFHDDLTHLRNRAYFMEQLRGALGRRRGGAVLFLDLDRFKLVNDSLGHQVGDLLLIEVAQRITSCMRPNDTLARFGGDEFAVLMLESDGLQTALFVAEAINTALRRTVWIDTQEIFSACSIGMVELTEHHQRPEDVLRDADIAMYHAKRHNRGGHAVFDVHMRGRAIEALELRMELRKAAIRNQFFLEYQPICDVVSSKIVGVEALIRWRHPKHGAVPPPAFIGVAEESGLIRDVGRWVMWEACTQLSAWRDAYPARKLRLSINTSGDELKDPRFASDVAEVLSGMGLDPQSLQLEVTESVFLQHPELMGEVLDQVRALGVRVALDDFGTGYSSFSYLDTYRVDAIKIDRSFVSRLATQPRTAAIVNAIVKLAHALDMEVVAEGVEDAAQLEALRGAGCRLVQGFLLGRPMPPEGVATALALSTAQ